MNVIDYSNYKNIIFLGDPHGAQNLIKIPKETPDNSIIFVCGDIGLGFLGNNDSYHIDSANELMEKKNSKMILIRGNHDNPSSFSPYSSLNRENVKVIKSYTIVKVSDKNILCVGGGISIDRSVRLLSKSYWSNEAVEQLTNEIKEELEKFHGNIDIVCSHSAPTFAKPINTSPYDCGFLVASWAEHDKTLYNDVWNDRMTLNNLYDFLKQKHNISHWIYGHFHDSFISQKDNTMFIGLDMFYPIDEPTSYKRNYKDYVKIGYDLYNFYSPDEYSYIKYI